MTVANDFLQRDASKSVKFNVAKSTDRMDSKFCRDRGDWKSMRNREREIETTGGWISVLQWTLVS